MPRLVSLWLPNWPAERLLRARRSAPAGPPPEPFVLVRTSGNRQEVAAASQQALHLGVRPGEPLARVRARLPGLHAEPHDAAADAEALERLGHWLRQRMSPLVALDLPDGLFLEAEGASHLFGGEARMLDGLVARLGRAGLSARAALADTAGAAHALARFGPSATLVVPPHAHPEALAPLPVAALRLPPEDTAGLARLGIVSIGDLLALPRASLGRRFGLDLLRRLDQALGRAGEPLAFLPHPEPLAATLRLAEPVAHAEALHALVDRLVPLLCQKLAQRGQGARRLDLLFQRLDGSIAAVRAGTAAPSREVAHLSRLLHLLVEDVDPGFGIEAATLACPLAAPLPPEQRGADMAPGMAETVDRLAARLGEGAVFRLAPRAAAFPESSVARAAPLAAISGGWPAHLPRPTRLVEPPERVEAIAMLPDRPPALFVWRGRRHRVRAADGPERMHGEWWKRAAEEGAVRDYFLVEDETGTRFWLFRRGDGEDPATGDFSWHLHGLFGG